jgi:hypothetical protein
MTDEQVVLPAMWALSSNQLHYPGGTPQRAQDEREISTAMRGLWGNEHRYPAAQLARRRGGHSRPSQRHRLVMATSSGCDWTHCPEVLPIDR